jgi:hypothetical protein
MSCWVMEEQSRARWRAVRLEMETCQQSDMRRKQSC